MPPITSRDTRSSEVAPAAQEGAQRAPSPKAGTIRRDPSVAASGGLYPAVSQDPIPRPEGYSGRVFWVYVAVVGAFHLLLPLAFVPYFFSWTGLLLVPLGNYIFCSTGIGLCYHRALTHGGLEMPKWLERGLAVLGLCNLMDPPARWVAIHRMHHQHSDNRPDPHSPWAGFFWGHFEWMLVENRQTQSIELYDRYARDIMHDRFYFWLERRHHWVLFYAVHAAMFFLAGLLIGRASGGDWAAGAQFGSSLLLWGVVFRTIYCWHITGAVNSIAHFRGYRNYNTDDTSTNHWLVALATNGEGWHNNHHAHPVCARHGHRWWELDVTYGTIRLLELLGLVREVKDQRVGYGVLEDSAKDRPSSVPAGSRQDRPAIVPDTAKPHVPS